MLALNCAIENGLVYAFANSAFSDSSCGTRELDGGMVRVFLSGFLLTNGTWFGEWQMTLNSFS